MIFPHRGGNCAVNCRGLIWRQRFCDCVARSLRHSLLVQRTALPRKHAQGTAPRSEPRFAPADRDEIKSRGSMRLRPPRPPGERAGWERQTTEMLCTAEKVSVFGAKAVCQLSARHDPNLGFPLRAAKQGRGNESVSGGDREPQFRKRNCY